MKKYVLLMLICMLANFIKAQEAVAENPFLNSKFYIELGVFVPQKTLKLGANGNINDDIDFGETFKLNENQATFFGNAEWRWSRKWKLTVEGFAVNSARRETLQEDIEFEDIIFEEGSYVKGGVEIALFRVFVGRTISSGPKHSLGAGLGIHLINIGAYIEGEVNSSNGNLEFQRRSVKGVIPLPNIGAWYHWAPTEKWGFAARVDWFGITVDNYSGGLWDIAPGVRYQIIKHLGVGFDYRFLLLNARVDEKNWDGGFNLDFTGPLFTITGNF